MGEIIKIEYASNDDVSPVTTTDYSQAVNREDGSRGINTNLSQTVLKRVKFPTPYNSDTDILELQVSRDRVSWDNLLSFVGIISIEGVTGLINTYWEFFDAAHNNRITAGIGLTKNIDEDFIAIRYGQYRAIGGNQQLSNWSDIVNPWYWRVAKKTFANCEDTADYNSLINKPKINGIELVGDKTFNDLGLNISNYYTKSEVNTALGDKALEMVDINSRILPKITYYVNNNGSDDNDGLSPSTAFQTFTKALKTAEKTVIPEITIQLAGGQTFLCDNPTVSFKGRRIALSGDSDSNRARLTINTTGSITSGITLYNCACILQYMEVTFSSSSLTSGYAGVFGLFGCSAFSVFASSLACSKPSVFFWHGEVQGGIIGITVYRVAINANITFLYNHSNTGLISISHVAGSKDSTAYWINDTNETLIQNGLPLRRITHSTAAPSGGASGNIHLQIGVGVFVNDAGVWRKAGI